MIQNIGKYADLESAARVILDPLPAPRDDADDQITPIREAVNDVRNGWSAEREITLRGIAMEGHIKAGNMQRAEEYAAEVERLQLAVCERRGWPCDWFYNAPDMTLATWAHKLAWGAYELRRRPDTSAAQAMPIAAE